MRKSARVILVFLAAICCASLLEAAELKLAWDPPDDGVTTGYVLFVGTTPQSYTQQIDIGFTTTYTVTGLADATTYYFTIRARDAGGTLSGPSNQVAGTTAPAPPVTPVTPRIGDFNDDASPDLLFQSTNGDLYMWFMNGLSLASGSWLSPAAIDPAWLVVGARDFTGDNQPDLLLQHQQTGSVKIYRMNGVSKVGEQDIPMAASTPWAVAATGDFNADGHADIAWENVTSGQVYVWFMKPANGVAGYGGAGGAFSGDYIRDANQNIITLGATTMRVAGSADMNQDGKPDLVWQDLATNELRVWYLNGVNRTMDLPLTPNRANPVWRIRVVGDYNGDTLPDLVWQNTSNGDLYVWFMNGDAMTSGAYLQPSRINMMWRMVAP